MAGLSTSGYLERQKELLERDRKEFGQQKAAIRSIFQQLPLNSLFKQVVIKLLDLSYVDRICNPSMEFLGRTFSRHPKVIARHIKAIEATGLFKVERTKAKGKNLSNRYVVNWDNKVWYLVKHPKYRAPEGQAVLAKLQEIIRTHTQTKLVAAKSRGTVNSSAEQEPYPSSAAVAVEPYGSTEQEPYGALAGTVRFHKLPQERGRHGHRPVDVAEPRSYPTAQQDIRDVSNLRLLREQHAASPQHCQLHGDRGDIPKPEEVLPVDAAAPHQYPTAGCGVIGVAAAVQQQPHQPQSRVRVLEMSDYKPARDVRDVQGWSTEEELEAFLEELD